jgi:hypothetical protein
MGSKSYSKGISWIDDCRIPFVDGGWGTRNQDTKTIFGSNGLNTTPNGKQNDLGRFPANLLVSDDMLNDGIKPNKGHRSKSKVSGYGEFGGGKSEYHGIGEYMNVDSTSRYYDIDKWFDNLIDV